MQISASLIDDNGDVFQLHVNEIYAYEGDKDQMDDFQILVFKKESEIMNVEIKFDRSKGVLELLKAASARAVDR